MGAEGGPFHDSGRGFGDNGAASGRDVPKMNSEAVKRVSRGLVAAAALLVAGSAVADWQLHGGLELRESYNSNLTLVDSGPEVSDYITEINPYIGISRQSRRLDLRLDYRLQNLFYADNSEYDDSYSQLLGRATVTAVDEFFFIETIASQRQQNINNAGRLVLDNTSVSANRADVTTASVRPFIRRRFGHQADLYLSAERGVVRYDGAALRNTYRNDYQFSLESGSAFGRMQWALRFSRQEVTGTLDTTTQTSEGEIDYGFTRRLALIAIVGYDNNRYVRTTGTSNPKGERWSVGVRWQPSRRTTVRATVGERYFGTTRSLALSHRARRTTASLDYSETVTVLANTLFAAARADADAAAAAAQEGGSGSPLSGTIDTSLPTIDDNTYLRKRLTGRLSLRSARRLWGLTLYDERRIYQSISREEHTWGGTLSLDWTLGRRNALRLSATRNKMSSSDNLRSTDVSRYEGRLSRRIWPRMEGSVGATRVETESSTGLSYRQNLVSVALEWRF